MQHDSSKTFSQLKQTEHVLRNAIFQATEVIVPASFIIANHKLDYADYNSNEGNDKIEEEEMKDQAKDDSWLARLTSLMTMAGKANVGLEEKTLTDAVKDLCTGQTLYFYLLDERTMHPVVLSEAEEEDRRRRGEVCTYPIELNKPTEFLLQMLPLLEVSYRTIAVVNGLAAIPRILGYSVPQLSEEVMTQAKDIIHCLKVESSVKRYNILDKLATSIPTAGDEEEVQPKPQQMQGKQKVRGGALRELQQFYQERNFNDFAGLVRVGLSNGEACWTTEAGKAILLDEQAVELKCGVSRSNDEGETQQCILKVEMEEDDNQVMEEALAVSERRRKRRFNEIVCENEERGGGEEEEEEEEYEVASGCQIA